MKHLFSLLIALSLLACHDHDHHDRNPDDPQIVGENLESNDGQGGFSN